MLHGSALFAVLSKVFNLLLVVKYLQLHLILSYFSTAINLYCMYLKIEHVPSSLLFCRRYTKCKMLYLFLNVNQVFIFKEQRKNY